MTIEKKCQNESCGKTFLSNRRDKKYCSDPCKTEAFYASKGKKLSGSPNGLPDVSHAGAGMNHVAALSPQYDYIIKDLTRQRDNLDSDLREERKLHKQEQDKHKELAKQFDEFKNDQRIQSIEFKKPALGGLLENDKFMSMIENAAPMILGKIMGGAGVSGFEDERVNVLANWFDKMEEDKKILFWQMIEPLSKLQPADAALLIQKFTSLMSTGTTAQATQKSAPVHQMGWG